MTDQEILDNAPKGATGVGRDSSNYIYRLKVRSLADIRRIVELENRIVELEKTLSKCERVIRVPDNENTVDDYDLKA